MLNYVPYWLMGPPYPLLWLPLLLLTLPVWLKTRSFGGFLRATGQVSLGILIPIYWFVLSTELKPDWKGESPLGWLGSYPVGQLWLSPLILWAASAFYARVVWRTSRPLASWIVFGYISGAAVSLFCLALALLCQWQFLIVVWPFIPPVGVAAYYTVVARRLLSQRRASRAEWAKLVGGTLPWWVACLWQSHRFHQMLPEEPPECFVVTAATYGHPCIVRTHFHIERAGVKRRVNRQLLTFWAFENRWSEMHPASHQWFRRIYNRIGPKAASFIRTPLLADAAYLVLKPAEWTARLFC